MKMDKTRIKQVTWNAETRMLTVEFDDGSKYGESGKTALSTLKQLNDNDVEVFETGNNQRNGQIQ